MLRNVRTPSLIQTKTLTFIPQLGLSISLRIIPLPPPPTRPPPQLLTILLPHLPHLSFSHPTHSHPLRLQHFQHLDHNQHHPHLPTHQLPPSTPPLIRYRPLRFHQTQPYLLLVHPNLMFRDIQQSLHITILPLVPPPSPTPPSKPAHVTYKSHFVRSCVGRHAGAMAKRGVQPRVPWLGCVLESMVPWANLCCRELLGFGNHNGVIQTIIYL